MASDARKWFIGCGIGCGVMLLIAIGLGTGGYFFIRQAVDKGKEIEATTEALQAYHGKPSDYVPDPSGAIPADRLEAFLAARDTMEPVRRTTGQVLQTLSDAESGEGNTSTIDKIKAGFSLVPSIMDFIQVRNEALIEAGMGPGEYLYIYSLAYFVLLEKDPADGPGFTLSSDDDEDDGRGFRFTTESDGEYDREKQAQEVRDYLHVIQMEMIRSQAQAPSLEVSEDWRAALAAETVLMEKEPYRLLWEEGLPAVLRNSLEPYRDRLEASYNEMTNILDCGLVESD